ncbi:TIGR01777 family oxidoreductase [Nocardioides limicola]|uniref:TIGR01777 family oxidoreductase n=1 Tax=Nocardioides limicola TaxID=2803368 RepID=UPI00193BA830|nr:TIGR01777 family oxidoreductase [Nocardioides sp. DJM-14]
MRIVVAGSSGFLGGALVPYLHERGHEVVRLVRRPAVGSGESSWDPYAGRIDQEVVDTADVVVNLAGSPTVGNPHSRRWAERLRESRVTTTALLASSIAAAARPPAFLAGNGISYYGDHGDEVLTEASTPVGDALLTRVTREWQDATEPAAAAGSRVCILRTSPVLDRSNPPLSLQLPMFRAGLGARIGDGSQWFPVISRPDWVAAVTWLAEHSDISGPVNLCCPQVPTNAEFTDALADAVGRRARLRVPTGLVRLGAGAMAPEVLGSLRTRPAAIEASGFSFADYDVRDVLRTALN